MVDAHGSCDSPDLQRGAAASLGTYPLIKGLIRAAPNCSEVLVSPVPHHSTHQLRGTCSPRAQICEEPWKSPGAQLKKLPGREREYSCLLCLSQFGCAGGMRGAPEDSLAGIEETKDLCHGSPLPPCLWGLQNKTQHPLFPLFPAPGKNPLHNLHHAMPLPPPSPYLKAARKQSILPASPDGEDGENTRCNQTQLGPSAAMYPRRSCPTRTPGNCIFIQEEPLGGSYKHFVMHRATS